MSRKFNKAYNVKPTVSFNIIVKNEEKTLRNCLESILAVADDIIIVDTGSTDKTVEIAKEYTDKVYHMEWKDDFALARNFADSKSVCGFNFSIDADEVLNENEYWKINKAKRTHQIIAHFVKTYNFTNHYYNNCSLAMGAPAQHYKWYHLSHKVRMYQNIKQLYWTGKIHEQISTDVLKKVDKGRHSVAGIDKGFKMSIWHMQIENPERREYKKKLYFEYGEEKIKTERTFNTLYEHGVLIHDLKDYDKSLALLKEAYSIRGTNTRPDMESNCLMLIGDICNRKGIPTFLKNDIDATEIADYIVNITASPVSYVIVTYKNKIEPTIMTLKSLFKAIRPEDQLIIVTNAASKELIGKIIECISNDGYIKGLIEAHQVSYIKYKENEGWTYSCNNAAESAIHDYIVFSNNDVIYPENYKKEMMKYFYNDQDLKMLGACSDNLNPKSSQFIGYDKAWPDISLETITKIQDDRNKYFSRLFLETHFLIGYSFMIKKDAFLEVGGFDNELFGNSMGFDDDDLCLKLKEKGFKIGIARDIVCYHLWTRDKTPEWIEGQKLNQQKFLEKWKDKI